LIPLASLIKNNENPTRVERIAKEIARWFHLSEWQITLLFTSPFLSYIAFITAGEGGQMIIPIAAILGWILAIGTVISGSFTGSIPKPKWKPVAVILPITLTIIAFSIRAFALGRIPIVLTGDEGSSGIAALGPIHGDINNPFISSWFSFPSLFFFIQSLSIRIFGQTTQALRLVSAFAGALTVTATYFTARVLFDRRTALVAAIFLTAYSYHINFSRIGLNNIWGGLWYTIVIGAVWYGWEHEEGKAFILAGLCLGIAQYFYPSGRVLILPIMAWFAIMAFVNREKFKRVFPNTLIMLLISFVVVLPLGLFYIHHPDEFMAPFNRVSIFGPILSSLIQSSSRLIWLILLMQITKGLSAFTNIPINAWYRPGIPLLLPLPASLFLLGILILLVRHYKDRFPLLALWILTFGFIGGLSESTPAAQRYIAAAPVCALLIGYGLSETTGLFERLWPKLNRLLFGVAVSAAMLMAVNELFFYFFVYTPKTIMDWSHNSDVIGQHLADYLREKPSDLEVVFFG
jgi:Dolichyl-phosphate-mannose-protein mannosyltransferase